MPNDFVVEKRDLGKPGDHLSNHDHQEKGAQSPSAVAAERIAQELFKGKPDYFQEGIALGDGVKTSNSEYFKAKAYPYLSWTDSKTPEAVWKRMNEAQDHKEQAAVSANMHAGYQILKDWKKLDPKGQGFITDQAIDNFVKNGNLTGEQLAAWSYVASHKSTIKEASNDSTDPERAGNISINDIGRFFSAENKQPLRLAFELNAQICSIFENGFDKNIYQNTKSDFVKADTNGDGFIEVGEYMNYREAKSKQAEFQRDKERAVNIVRYADHDHDGAINTGISLDEQLKYGHSEIATQGIEGLFHDKHGKDTIDQYDKNKDWNLSAAEITEALQANRKAGDAQGETTYITNMAHLIEFETRDLYGSRKGIPGKDLGDGKLSLEEFTATIGVSH